MEDYLKKANELAGLISALSFEKKVQALNESRSVLHSISPFIGEPVDLVCWIPANTLDPNDYNPNSVAKPEMELLELSIMADGYTQPIVAHECSDGYETVDGFHRSIVGRTFDTVKNRVSGYLPITKIKEARGGKADRMAATIRHNRARGKHTINSMSEIVVDLTRRNWSDKKIGKELGMDPEEVIRLKQISGLQEAFGDRNFSEAWEIKLGEENG